MVLFQLKKKRPRRRRSWRRTEQYYILNVFHHPENIDLYQPQSYYYKESFDMLDQRYLYYTIHSTGYTAFLHFVDGVAYYDSIRSTDTNSYYPF